MGLAFAACAAGLIAGPASAAKIQTMEFTLGGPGNAHVGKGSALFEFSDDYSTLEAADVVVWEWALSKKLSPPGYYQYGPPVMDQIISQMHPKPGQTTASIGSKSLTDLFSFTWTYDAVGANGEGLSPGAFNALIDMRVGKMWFVSSQSLQPAVFPAGGVPEPASWSLMILGVGAAGAALRRRRLALAA
jgi:hypothetical protein